jgi:competence protein CoiA
MKYALVNESRQEARPSLSGKCLGCDQAMVAKCGEVRVWHWAHPGRRRCDPWWENETPWHRAWKNYFPADWQEIVHRDSSGEKHIADVRTDQGWVFEFQHSIIKPEERRARDGFYKKLIWVIDGTTRKRDQNGFIQALQTGKRINGKAPVWRVSHPDECRLFQEWVDCRSPVFVDFGDPTTVWWLYPKASDGSLYVAAFSRALLIDIHRSGASQAVHAFTQLVLDLPDLVSRHSAAMQAGPVRQVARPRYFQFSRSRRF